MRGRLIIFLLVAATAVFFNFWNARKVLNYTRSMDHIEKTVAAVKNINTELEIEYDDLCSGPKHLSLVSVELSNFIPEQQQGRIIYVHEPRSAETRDSYCIVDLIATKAQAKDIQIIPD
jgi:hypothetical protein